MARQRMIVLYDQSAAFGGLVVGTGNRTEMLLGYSTLFGDSAHAINPIGDLYKCQVRQVAAHLGTPRSILDKPPSADLWVGQTDEAELGFTYDQADQILHLLYDQRLAPAQIAAHGFDLSLVREDRNHRAPQPIQAGDARDLQDRSPHRGPGFPVCAGLGDVERDE